MRDVLDFVKLEVRNASAYTLRQFDYEIKINQNENPFDLPREIKAAILAQALDRSWSRYPEFVPSDLLRRLAGHIGWREDGILAGNGSNELIQAVLTAVAGPGSRVIVPMPTFTLYRLISSVLGAAVIEVPLAADYSFDVGAIKNACSAKSADVLILCSPNNPTGCAIRLCDLKEILEDSDVLVIVDQAYVEFGGDDVTCLLDRYDRLVVLRTFSKAMSLAGLRIGYVAGAAPLIREVSKAKLPYNLNCISHSAAIAVLDNMVLLRERISYLQREREEVFGALKGIPGVRPYPSAANFVLFEVDRPPSAVFDDLLRLGILIRDVSHYPMLSKALRVTVGTSEDNRRFIGALKEVMQ